MQPRPAGLEPTTGDWRILGARYSELARFFSTLRFGEWTKWSLQFVAAYFMD